MRISDWSSDVCSSDLSEVLVSTIAGAVTTTVSRSVASPAGPVSGIPPRPRLRVTVWPTASVRVCELVCPSAVTSTRYVPGGRPARSEEHTSELQSLMRISYAVFCLKKNKRQTVHDYSSVPALKHVI